MLTTYQPTFDYSALDRANLAESSRIKYKSAIAQLVQSGINPFDSQALAAYASTLPHSARAFLKASLSLMAKEYQRLLKANANTTDAEQIQVMLWKLEAMDQAITVQTAKGTKAHTWLSREQVEQITATCDQSTIEGKRDWIVLAVLLGAGLRRDELSTLAFDALRQQPARKGLRDILQVKGKGGKFRVIPISPLLGQRLREWKAITGPGNVARSINKSGVIGESLSAIGIHNIVRKYGTLISLPELDSHDLRRSYARLGYDAGIPVEQISKLLGHSDVKTTMLYLGIEIDIESTVSDFIPLSGD